MHFGKFNPLAWSNLSDKKKMFVNIYFYCVGYFHEICINFKVYALLHLYFIRRGTFQQPLINQATSPFSSYIIMVNICQFMLLNNWVRFFVWQSLKWSPLNLARNTCQQYLFLVEFRSYPNIENGVLIIVQGFVYNFENYVQKA